MGAVVRIAFTRWELRPEVLLPWLLLTALYLRGWLRLRRTRRGARLASGLRLTAYLAGVGVLLFALLSGVDALGEQLFTAHMVQHELLMMAAAPLLLLGAPFPVGLWGLPAGLRRALAPALGPKGRPRRLLALLGAPRTAWILYVGSLWLWHAPAAYDAALRWAWVHDLEHLSFTLTALLFWWVVTAAAPRLHGLGYGGRIAAVLTALAQNELLAVGITFADRPLYQAYLYPRAWGPSPLEDQQLGGAIMWVPGGMMYVLTVIVLLVRLLDRQERAARRRGEPVAPPSWADVWKDGPAAR